MLKQVAVALGPDLRARMAFVGGCTTLCTLLIGAYAGFLFLIGLVSYWIEGQGVIQFGALALAVFALALFINASACFLLHCDP